MHRILQKYYNLLLHFKDCESINKDVIFMFNYADTLLNPNEVRNYKFDFDCYEAEDYFVNKYKTEINNVGKFINNSYATHNVEFLHNKTEVDVAYDIMLIAKCVIISYACKMGFAENVQQILKEIEDYDNKNTTA